MNPKVVSVVFKCGHTVEMFSPGLSDPKGLWQTDPKTEKLCGPCLKKSKKISG